ncbi:hypothetical protein ABWH92_01275 [Ahrensia marina]|uniref:capsular polysaccharide export protein, LipB/KpsS family n=1 Tax=Ahrensia marina TaxID=1514904 RepID=UPI0035D0AFB4
MAETLRGFEELLAATDPDIILTFGTATLSDYIAGRLAKARGIDYLQLKATKVRNYVSLNDDMIALSSHIAKHYAARDTSRQAKAIARSYIDTVKAEGVKYEGAIRLDQRLLDFKPHRQLVKLAKAAALELRRQGNSVVRDDNHLDGFIIPALIEGIVQPWRARKLSKRLGKSFLQLADIEKLGDFGFFPLHFEPEVSMQVFGRPFQNQIELIRTLALALPSNVVLLVKEHPRSIGFRPVGYYEKILEIPNVRLADPFLPSIALVKRAKLVAIISGTIGLEAAILGKPVLAFGRPTYCALPGAIVSKVKDLWRLPQQITTLLTLAETSGDDAIECFIAAIVDGSVPIDLYANLLGKENRHREVNDLAGDETDQRSRDLERLADYTRLRIGATRPH